MVYFVADNIISSLGFNSAENFTAMEKGMIGIGIVDDKRIYPEPFSASRVNTEQLADTFSGLSFSKHFSRAEKMGICSISEALLKSNIDPQSPRTAFIFSTTKGNIDELEHLGNTGDKNNNALLWKMAETISKPFNNPNQPIVISNACISGVLALNTAAGLIDSGTFDHVVICGVDIVSRFVVSGFMSFLSLSPNACKPFDKDRDGLSLGEGAGTIILSKEKSVANSLVFGGGSSANDANHISGPSRNGEGSFIAIKRAFKEAGIDGSGIDHISAHGTATLYNDEMESISISRHGMEKVAVNSLKGYLGHTLGAAGVIETAALLHEMRSNTMLGSAGFEQLGVSKPINVLRETESKELSVCLKMASGFGGSNAALIINKV